MTQCDDCPKSIVRLLPWILGIILTWGAYLTVNAWANDKGDARDHQKIANLVVKADRLITVVEKQTAATTNLNTALKVHIAETKKR